MHFNWHSVSGSLGWGCIIRKCKCAKKHIFVRFHFFALDLTIYFTFVFVACLFLLKLGERFSATPALNFS